MSIDNYSVSVELFTLIIWFVLDIDYVFVGRYNLATEHFIQMANNGPPMHILFNGHNKENLNTNTLAMLRISRSGKINQRFSRSKLYKTVYNNMVRHLGKWYGGGHSCFGNDIPILKDNPRTLSYPTI